MRIVSNKFKDNEYDDFTIAYETKSKKIAYYAGFVEGFKNLNECLKYRDEQVLKNRKKFILHKKNAVKSTHNSGLIQEAVRFQSIKTEAKFTCDYFEDEKDKRVDYRFDVLTSEFNEWVVELDDTKTTSN